mgnify:CR=1 FL=1|jgi:hypothetical protein
MQVYYFTNMLVGVDCIIMGMVNARDQSISFVNWIEG